ncbi:MAG: aminotransferase class V-fold PLP-dependent enzyme [Myxococcaceae bacterium]|nr:aminotransferase class V-fold PLP-dependent enzyme [Myxococcaceae bacterium]
MSDFLLSPEITFLNHGSYGACPRLVIETQRAFQDELESNPIDFFNRKLETLLDAARVKLSAFVGCAPQDMVFVPNATTAVNTVVAQWKLTAGDEVLVTQHAYNACTNAVRAVCERSGATMVLATPPFPVTSPQRVVDVVLAAVTSHTRYAMLDHVTSPTGLVFPVERLIPALRERGVECLIDGAHVPGMLPLDINKLGAAWYTGNLHKWLCTPKGSAFLHVRHDMQRTFRPLIVGHAANSSRTDKSRFQLDFDIIPTDDPTPFLCIPRAIEVMAALHPDGWPGVMAANHALALQGRDVLLKALGFMAPAPDDMLGALAAIPLPDTHQPRGAEEEPLRERLFREHRIEVPIFSWPNPRGRVLRISAQRYNRLEQYEKLAKVLPAMLDERAHVN